MRSTLVVLVVAVVVALAAPARAQPEDVVATFQAGVDAFRLGDYPKARELLEKARAKDPKLPGPHRFLAAVAQAEKRWEDCVSSARTAISLKPDSTEVEATRKVHDFCRGGLGRTSFTGSYGDGGAIGVTANVEGATVSLGGLRYGATPLAPRALAAGIVEVLVEKTGWLPATVTVEVLPQVVTDVEVRLEPDPGAGAGDGKPPGVDPTTHGWLLLGDAPAAANATVKIDGELVALEAQIPLRGGVHEVNVEAEGRERWRRRVRITRGQKTRVAVDLPPNAERGSRRRTAMYILAGAGAIAAFGMGAAVISSRAAEDARDIYEIETSRPTAVPLEDTLALEPLHTRDDLEDARSRARTWSYVSLAAYGVAIVGAGVGGYLLIKSRTGEVDGQPAPFAIAPVPEGGAVVTGSVRW
jgi:hypothetical protein